MLWNLAHRDDCPNDTMEHALNAHIKILDYSCSQERESQKLRWLQRCVDEVTQGNWVIPALKQMKEICMLYLEVSQVARLKRLLGRACRSLLSQLRMCWLQTMVFEERKFQAKVNKYLCEIVAIVTYSAFHLASVNCSLSLGLPPLTPPFLSDSPLSSSLGSHELQRPSPQHSFLLPQ